MKRVAYALLAALTFAGTLVVEFALLSATPRHQHDSFMFATEVVVIVVAGCAMGAASLLRALDHNIYGLTSGKVIAHLVVAPEGTHRAGLWAIKIQDDKGRCGWIYFEENPLQYYYLGSDYP